MTDANAVRLLAPQREKIRVILAAASPFLAVAAAIGLGLLTQAAAYLALLVVLAGLGVAGWALIAAWKRPGWDLWKTGAAVGLVWCSCSAIPASILCGIVASALLGGAAKQEILNARYCDHRVGAPLAPEVAQALKMSPFFEGGSAWLDCVAGGGDLQQCGTSPASLRAIESWLPERFSVSIAVADGIVKSCKVEGSAGW
jgi:hypothetical protein